LGREISTRPGVSSCLRLNKVLDAYYYVECAIDAGSVSAGVAAHAISESVAHVERVVSALPTHVVRAGSASDHVVAVSAVEGPVAPDFVAAVPSCERVGSRVARDEIV
jgi:hypothetical protein